MGWESKQLENAAWFCKCQHSPLPEGSLSLPQLCCPGRRHPVISTLPFLCHSPLPHVRSKRDAGVQVPYKQAWSPWDPGASGSPHTQTSPQLRSPNQRGKRYGKLRQEKRLSLPCTSIARPCAAAGSLHRAKPYCPTSRHQRGAKTERRCRKVNSVSVQAASLETSPKDWGSHNPPSARASCQ